MSLGQGDWVGVVPLPSAGLTKYTRVQVSHPLWESDSVLILRAGRQALLSFQMAVAHVLGLLPPPRPSGTQQQQNQKGNGRS